MRTLAIGDIHGCLRALETLAAYVPIARDDQIITLGDYVDRGPDTQGVVDWVIDRTLEGRCVPLLGNHEIMLLDALNGRMPMEQWLGYGGRQTLKSYTYPGRTPHPDSISELHRRFLANDLRWIYSTETHIFAHAFVNGELPLDRQPDWSLFWERCDGMGPHYSGKTVIVGHSSQKNGVPLNAGHFVCIDTWVYGNGWLTCLDVDSGQYWQANQSGQTRRGDLPDPVQLDAPPWDFP